MSRILSFGLGGPLIANNNSNRMNRLTISQINDMREKDDFED